MRDPNTHQVLTWDKSKSRFWQWHMGHRPGKEYRLLRQKFINCIITRKKMLDEYNDPKNYYPEHPIANMSHKYEQK